jgi:hypothetical protein
MPFKFRPDIENVTGKVAGRVVQVTDQTRAALRLTILRMFKDKIDPRKGAKMIRDMVGMTEKQALAALKFRSGLEASGLSAAKVDRLFGKFAAKQIKRRSFNIARTETMTVLNDGQQIAWERGIAKREIDTVALVKEWIVSGESLKPCPICESMTGQQVEIQQRFSSPGPPAHPSCRCTVALVRRPKTKAPPVTDTMWTKANVRIAAEGGSLFPEVSPQKILSDANSARLIRATFSTRRKLLLKKGIEVTDWVTATSGELTSAEARHAISVYHTSLQALEAMGARYNIGKQLDLFRALGNRSPDVINKFGDVPKTIKVWFSRSKNNVMAWQSTGETAVTRFLVRPGVHINVSQPAWTSKEMLTKMLKAEYGAKWLANSDWYGIMSHEMGHALHFHSNPGLYSTMLETYKTKRTWVNAVSSVLDRSLTLKSVRGSVGELAQVRADAWTQLRALGFNDSGKLKTLAGKVSRYATTDPAEFVAEVHALLVRGKAQSDQVMLLYRALGGHVPKLEAVVSAVPKIPNLSKLTVPKKAPPIADTPPISATPLNELKPLTPNEKRNAKRVRLWRQDRGASWEEIDIKFGRPRQKGNWSWRIFHLAQEEGVF